MKRDSQDKRKGDRRQVERREPKRGVNIRHDDEDGPPKRVRKGRLDRKTDNSEDWPDIIGE